MVQNIELRAIDKFYPGDPPVVALQQLNLTIVPHQINALLGPNGAGKSTCMQILAGLLSADGGEIIYPSFLSKQDMAYLPENPPLYPSMKVQEYLFFVAQIFGLSNQEAKEETEAVLELCQLQSLAKNFCGNLSKGQKQKVGLAQSLVTKAKLIILDEPTVGLDPIAVVHMRKVIQQLAPQKTVLISSHLLHEVDQLCTYANIIKEGRCVAQGKMEDLRHEYAQHLPDNNNKVYLHFKFNELSPDVWKEFENKYTHLAYHSRVQADRSMDLYLNTPEATSLRKELALFFLNRGQEVLAMDSENISLEDVFIAATEVERRPQ